MPPEDPRVVPLGDSAWLVAFEPVIAEDVNARVLALAAAVREARLTGVRDVVPAFSAVAVHVDPLAPGATQLGALLAAMAQSVHPRPVAEDAGVVEIPVCYGDAFGPDLAVVASWAGCSEADVVTRHAAPSYRVYMLGFLPGFPYLAPVDSRIAMPRRDVPRTRVPAGSIGIAGAQTGIYPAESPGGWQIIGRTPAWLFDATRPRPARLAPGRHVRFVPIDEDAFHRIATGAGQDTWR